MFGFLVRKPKLKKQKTEKAEMLIVVYGNTEGSITGANKVIVVSTGCCKSNIKADHLDVAGEVYGNVDVRELVIRGTGRIHGQVKYKELALLEDAVFQPDLNGKRKPAPAVKALEPAKAKEGPPSKPWQCKEAVGRKKAEAGALEQTQKGQQEPSFTTSF
ncbi:MAG TPA: polymer-forming cytoskeletal protein [bacterium]|nr:polymer-forming cytoskeletal protein [bacterium]